MSEAEASLVKSYKSFHSNALREGASFVVLYRRVAQWLELHAHNVVVIGSSPISSTILNRESY